MTAFGEKFDRFMEIVKKLRSEDGCPWDKEQSPISLKRYLIEETQEAIEAITANNPQHVQEHYNDKPFFVDFPFGYVAAGVNWYEGAGISFAAAVWLSTCHWCMSSLSLVVPSNQRPVK